MNYLETKLRNIKNESFTIIIEKDYDEVLFRYDKEDNAIVVSNPNYFSAADYYEFSEINQLVSLYGEFQNLINN
tara:strand:- start:167 stop:388 length:222 start_codon:yes stop_codon:yes gene_type:complete